MLWTLLYMVVVIYLGLSLAMETVRVFKDRFGTISNLIILIIPTLDMLRTRRHIDLNLKTHTIYRRSSN